MELSEWLHIEVGYARAKRGERRQEDIDNLAHCGHSPEVSIFWRDTEAYVKRAAVLGLDTPDGRQALGKALAIVYAMVQATEEIWGDLPGPGVPSGA